MNSKLLNQKSQIKWFARFERHVIEQLSSLKSPLTPQRNISQKVHMTLADAAELDATGQVACLIEIKGRRLYGGDSVAGNMLRMFFEDNQTFKRQFDQLIKTGLPYIFIIGFHRANFGENIEQLYIDLDNCPIHDYMVIIGRDDICACNHINHLRDIDLPGTSYAEAVSNLLNVCPRFTYDQLLQVAHLPSDELHGNQADERINALKQIPVEPVRSRSINEIQGIHDLIAQLSKSGMSHQQILDDLISKNITHDERPLMLQDINNRLAPQAMREMSFEDFEQELIKSFKSAYGQVNGNKRALSPNSVRRFSPADGDCIRASAKAGKLPAVLNVANTTLSRWFRYHTQSAFFVACKSQARYQFNHKLDSKPVRREDIRDAVQGELWAYGDSRLCQENREIIDILLDTVKAQILRIESLERRLDNESK
jgi:hypothetical protein